MDWVLTNAQYELFIYDCPLVLYKKTDSKEKRHTAKEMAELTRRWEERKKAQEEKGEKVSINDFLANGINALKEQGAK